MTRAAFESSLATLRDNVVMAIERRELGVVEDGLDVYARLIEAVLDEQRKLQNVALHAGGPPLPLGREWEQILRDLHGIIDSVSASGSRLLWVDVLSWIRRVAVACAERGAIGALSYTLQLFESAWNQELASRNSDSSARQDALLLRLSELGGIYLEFSSLSAEDAHRADIAYTKTFVHIVKAAIESPDPDAAQIAVKYFLRGNLLRRNSESKVTAVGLLALAAWTLYLVDRGNDDQLHLAVFDEIRRAFGQSTDFHSLLEEYDQLSDDLGVQWWELNQRGPMSSGVMQIDDYAILGLLFVAGHRLIRQSFDPSKRNDVQFAQRLLSITRRLEEGGFAKVYELLAFSLPNLSRISDFLSKVIEEGEAITEESYAKLPLDSGKLSSFKRAFRERLSKKRKKSLSAALLETNRVGDVPAEANFGIDNLVPRWYFANTGIHADPSELANNLVDALIRGEEEKILALSVGDPTLAPEIALDALRAALEEALDDRNPATAVIVTNSYEAFARLTGGMQDNDSATATVRGLGPIYRVVDDRDPYVALMSRGQTPRVRLIQPEEEFQEDQEIPDLAVILGVSEISAEDIDRILGAERKTRVDEARLRGSVRVRVLEHFDVTLEPNQRAHVWRLPASTY